MQLWKVPSVSSYLSNMDFLLPVHPWPSNMTGSLVCPSISGALCLKFIITNISPWHAFKFYKGYPVKSFTQPPTLNVYQPWQSGVMVHVAFTFIFVGGFFFLPLIHITVFFFVLEESESVWVWMLERGITQNKCKTFKNFVCLW